MRTLSPALFIAALLAVPPAARAQAPAPAAERVHEALRLSGPAPRIDGVLDDAAWTGAAPASGFVQRGPQPGAPATEWTEARIAFDDGALYVALRLADRQPSSIAAPLSRRDAGTDASDWAYVMLDPDDDNRTAFVFAVNPRGVQKDYQVYDDAREDLSWDAVWTGAAARDSGGWTAELRIPLSLLRVRPGDTRWGLNLGRYLSRTGEQSFWATWLPGDAGYVSRFGVLAGVGGVRAPRGAELLPYVSSRVARAPARPGDPFTGAGDVRGSAGVDVRYGLGRGMQLNAAVNPDFGQVEADPSEVNLSAFETRYGERRPFFVENAGLFRFDLGGGDDLFYSRRIGRAPQGAAPPGAVFRDAPDAASILGGVKIAGQPARGWSVGLLDVVTAAEQVRYVDTAGVERSAPVEPLTHYGAFRATRDLAGGRSGAGVLVTAAHRRLNGAALDFLPARAYAAGLDGRHRFGGAYEASGWLAASQVEGGARAISRLQLRAGRYLQRPDADHLRYDPERTSLAGVAGQARVARVAGNWRWELLGGMRTPGFEVNDLGYQQSADRVTQEARIERRGFRAGRVFRSWSLRLSQTAEWTTGGERTGTQLTLFSNFELANRWSGFAQVLRRTDALSVSSLRGGPALREPGYFRPVLSLSTDRRRRVSGSLRLNARIGDMAGDRTLDVAPAVSLRPAPHVEMSLGAMLRRGRVPLQYVDQRSVDGETRYFFAGLDQWESSLTARLNYGFSPRLSVQLYAQPYLSAGDYGLPSMVLDARAATRSGRFRRFGPGEAALDSAGVAYAVDVDGDGAADASVRNRDYRVGEMNSTAVLRWEYRPGSTVFVVWAHTRAGAERDGFAFRDGLGTLLDARGTNVVAIKVSYWLGW